MYVVDMSPMMLPRPKYTLRALVGGIVVHTIDEMDLPAPQVAPGDLAALARAKAELLAE